MRTDYLNIPIRDCGEPLQEIPESAFPRVTPHPYRAVGAPYSGSPWWLRSGALSALYRAQSLLSARRPGWCIALFDAYRPLAVQHFMVWDAFRREAQALGCLTRLASCVGPDALERLDPEIYALLAPKVYRFWGIPDPDPCRPPPHSTGATILQHAAQTPPGSWPRPTAHDSGDRDTPVFPAGQTRKNPGWRGR